MTSLHRRRPVAAGYRAPGGGPLASDSFDRADNPTSLGTADTGQTWTAHGPAWGISGNRAVPPEQSDYTVASLDVGETDVTVAATVALTSGSSSLALPARVIDDSNFVFLAITWLGDRWLARVFQRVAGGFTGLTTAVDPVPGTSAPPAALDLRITVIGSGGEAWVNDGSVGTFTGIDSSLLASTRHGMGVGASSGDNRYEDLTITAA